MKKPESPSRMGLFMTKLISSFLPAPADEVYDDDGGDESDDGDDDETDEDDEKSEDDVGKMGGPRSGLPYPTTSVYT